MRHRCRRTFGYVMRLLQRLLLCSRLGALALALVGQAAAAERATTTKVWFVRQGRAGRRVSARWSGVPGAVRALLAGPTTLERAKGIATAVPVRTPLLSLVVRKRIVTVNLGGRFADGGRPDVAPRPRRAADPHRSRRPRGRGGEGADRGRRPGRALPGVRPRARRCASRSCLRAASRRRPCARRSSCWSISGSWTARG